MTIDISKHVRISSKSAEGARAGHKEFAADFATLTGQAPSADHGATNFLAGALPQVAAPTPAQKADEASPLPPFLANQIGRISRPVLELANWIRKKQDKDDAGRPIPLSITKVAAEHGMKPDETALLLSAAIACGLVRRSANSFGIEVYSVPLPGARQ